MTALEVKDDILLLLSRERNTANLERIRAFIAALAFEGEEESEDWWENLPEDQQQRLLHIISEIKEGKNTISNEEAKVRLKHYEAQEPTAKYQVTSKKIIAKQAIIEPKLSKNKKKVKAHPVNVRVISSRLKSIVEGKIYRVLFDKRNEEQYVVDENGEKVLFDKNIFSCEYI